MDIDNEITIADTEIFDRVEKALGQPIRDWLLEERAREGFKLSVTLYALHALVFSASVPFAAMQCPPENLQALRERVKTLTALCIDNYFDVIMVGDTQGVGTSE